MNKKDMFIKEKLQQDKVISDRANKIFDNIKEEFKVERKVIKISLGTFIAIAASLVIVGFIGINIYANSLGKPNIISGIQALLKDEPEVNTDEIAEELFKKAMLAIRDPYKYYEDTDSEAEEIEDKYYKKTNSTYDEVKLKYSEIFTEEALENVLALKFYNKKGILYAIAQAGGTPWQIVELKVEKINQEKEELTYNAIYKLSYTDDPAGKEPKEQKCQFKIKKVDGEYRISATNFLNIDGIEKNQNNIPESNLDNETAKTIIQSYLNIIGAREGSPIEALTIEEIGLIDRYSEISGGDSIDKEGYRSSNINYKDFKNKMLQYMTEELFNEVGGYKNVNGKLYIFDGGATGIGFDIKEISLISSNENNYKYSIKAIEYPPEEGINCIGEVELQKNKEGKYVVSALGWTLVEEPENENNVDNNNPETSDSNQNIHFGDVDLDGEVTDWDEIYLTRYLNNWDGYGLSENAKLNADVNDDGIITQGDANILKKYLVGEITKLPYRISGTELISKKLQGITINYPSDWSSYEFSGDMGENIVAFAGRVNNVDISVNVYNPFYVEGDYKSLIKNECSKYGIEYRDHFVGIGFNIGSTDSKYLEWQELPVREDMISYYHIVNEKNIAYKIEVCIFNYEKDTNLVPAYRVIDDIITGASISLNY